MDFIKICAKYNIPCCDALLLQNCHSDTATKYDERMITFLFIELILTDSDAYTKQWKFLMDHANNRLTKNEKQQIFTELQQTYHDNEDFIILNNMVKTASTQQTMDLTALGC